MALTANAPTFSAGALRKTRDWRHLPRWVLVWVKPHQSWMWKPTSCKPNDQPNGQTFDAHDELCIQTGPLNHLRQVQWTAWKSLDHFSRQTADFSLFGCFLPAYILLFQKRRGKNARLWDRKYPRQFSLGINAWEKLCPCAHHESNVDLSWCPVAFRIVRSRPVFSSRGNWVSENSALHLPVSHLACFSIQQVQATAALTTPVHCVSSFPCLAGFERPGQVSSWLQTFHCWKSSGSEQGHSCSQVFHFYPWSLLHKKRNFTPTHNTCLARTQKKK